MIIDLHFHTKQYSSCSKIDIEEGIRHAKQIGLDGICITDHDVFASRKIANQLQKKYNILVFVGVEILTYEGDIICFGLEKIPDNKLHAKELIKIIESNKGACIAAHPFRINNRGLKEKIKEVHGLHAIEVFNGNTLNKNNLKAKEIAENSIITQVGGSDAHTIDNIGCFATEFLTDIHNETDLINAIRKGNVRPYVNKDFGDI